MANLSFSWRTSTKDELTDVTLARKKSHRKSSSYNSRTTYIHPGKV